VLNHYMHQATRSLISLDQGQYAPDWTVVQVSVLWPHRGKGFAHRLMCDVTRDADIEGAVLWLHVQPDLCDRGLTFRGLTLFYGRHGFTPVPMTYEGEPISGIMRREPCHPNATPMA
jgi:GNAT superfamily N-acetyltransferase